MADSFSPVKKALTKEFLPALLRDAVKTTTNCQDFLTFPVKFSCLGIPDTKAEAQAHFDMSVGATGDLIASLQNSEPINAQTAHKQRLESLQSSFDAMLVTCWSPNVSCRI